MDPSGAHMSKMAKHRLRVNTSAKSATYLHSQEACEGEVGRLVSLAYRHIELCLPKVEMLAAMQKPFPALTSLWLESREETAPIIPDSFLGGSAPLPFLRLFRLNPFTEPFSVCHQPCPP